MNRWHGIVLCFICVAVFAVDRVPFRGPPQTGPTGPAVIQSPEILNVRVDSNRVVYLDWTGSTDGLYRVERAAQSAGPWVEIGWTWAHSNEVRGIVLFNVYPPTPAIGSTLASTITQTDWGYTNDRPQWRAFAPPLPTKYPCAFTDQTLGPDDRFVFYRLRHQFDRLSSNDVLPAVQVVMR